MNKTFDLIKLELASAKKKHPEFPKSVVAQVAIMMEEAGESMQAANDIQWGKSTDKEHLKSELIQTAAMCMRCIENMEQW